MEIEITAMAIATAIKSTGKFGASEHKAAMDYILAEAENDDDKRDGLSRIGNVSAVRQELEKHGIIAGTTKSKSAFVQHIEKAQAILAAKK